MDFMRALQYAFDDEEWGSKFLIGAFLSMVPILNFASLGYLVQIIRNVSEGQAQPLPKWENITDLLIKGLYVFIAEVAYFFLPAMLVLTAMTPLFFLPFLSGANEDATNMLAGISVLGAICVGMIGIAVWIVMYVF